MNYYKRFPGDYLRDTVHLTMIEDGAYTRLLDWCYANERPIPKVDVYRIARAQTKAERVAVDAVIADFFHKTADGYEQGRAKTAISKRQQVAEVHRDAGRKGGRPSIQIDNQNETNLDSEIETKLEPNAKALPSNHQTIKPSKPKSKNKNLAAAPPEWIDFQLWEQWREARKAMHAAMTPHAEHLLIGKLELFRSQGADPKAIIEQSIERNWKGFFPVEPDRKNGHNHGTFESRVAESERVMRDLTGGGTKPVKGRVFDTTD